ncbi:MAG: methyltransferase domain-containing protein [Wenzhouxiangella sp.]|jgi:ubiquinone/menaquinone biosynthesis C-methylase UbiE|nr:methyltransferase domain-containing protein [Wenzhouxiangella sp.]
MDYTHWSDYWATGALTSLPQDFSFNYDGEVATFWRQQFDALPSPARLLDVCTGNGPIALLAAAWSRDSGRELEITAVDAASLHPDLIARRAPESVDLIEAIRFVGQTTIETLPFDDGYFDLLTSQFGLEYSDLNSAAPELARVLAPGGRLAAVCHGADSEMIATMGEEQADYMRLEQSRVLDVLRSWEAGQLSDPDFRTRLDKLLRRLGADPATRRSPLLSSVVQGMAGLLNLPGGQLREQRDAVAGYRRQLLAGRSRLDDMLRVNRRIADNPDWHQPLADAGLELVHSEALVYRAEHPMGTCLVWRKP